MTRTFAPKPDYAVRYWQRRGLKPPRVDALEVLGAAGRYLADVPPRVTGAAARATPEPLTF